MSDLYEKIVGQRGSLERLVARIPGFAGYQEKAARRKADTMIREHIADELSKRIDRFVRIEKKALDAIGLSAMSKTRSVKDRIQMFQARVKTAAPGYSGMWSANKIGSEELEKIYSFDEALIRYVDRFDEALNGVEKAVDAKSGFEEALSALDELAVEANEAFGLRDDVLLNIDKSLSG